MPRLGLDRAAVVDEELIGAGGAGARGLGERPLVLQRAGAIAVEELAVELEVVGAAGFVGGEGAVVDVEGAGGLVDRPIVVQGAGEGDAAGDGQGRAGLVGQRAAGATVMVPPVHWKRLPGKSRVAPAVPTVTFWLSARCRPPNR